MTAAPMKPSLDRQDKDKYPSLVGIGIVALRKIFEVTASLVRHVSKTPPLWIPLLALLVFSAIFRFTDADLVLARLFYRDDGSGSHSLWPLGQTRPCLWLYHYGVYPAWILGLGGLAVWLAAFLWKQFQPIRNEGLFLFLMLILGPGLLVNCISKPYCGRPRPQMTKPFGGDKDFLPLFTACRNLEGDCCSFPSGHASTGFYLMAPAFVLYRRRSGWAAAFLALGLAAGCTIGIARMAAGAHFASDVLWAGGFVYFTGLLLAAAFRFSSRGEKRQFAANPYYSFFFTFPGRA